ncbi:aminoglycoside phosphotransferase family protein [Pseudonocardiaceae bacterium YIM PH 21723]|nr:aminoglycoside phosphotransferase family protein [Pseudonocardiaceae bacterium YIM PH 21723]
MIIEWLRTDFGLSIADLEPVVGGADAAAEVWRAQADDGTGYAVKWSAGGSTAALVLSDRLGLSGVPRPLRTITGELWSDRDGRRLSVLPWVPGQNGWQRPLTNEGWQAYGALLAAVHHSSVDPGQLPVEEYDHAPFARQLADTEYRDHELLRELLRHADGLAGDLRARRPPLVPCHADPHLGNLLADGTAVSLIDWDDAVLAPRERDLMFVLGFEDFTAEQRDRFFTGYGPAAVDRPALAYYLCVRAVQDVAELASNTADILSPTGFARRALASAEACRS